MAKNEIAEIIGGTFALIVFLLIGGAILGSLSQISGGTSDLEKVMSLIFVISTTLIIVAIIISLIKFIEKIKKF